MQILIVTEKQAEAVETTALFGPEFSVSMCDDFEDVAYLCKTYGYNAVILDDMASARALRVVKSLRDAHLATPILVLLGQHDSAAIAGLLNAGADDCLVHPVIGIELCARIHAVARRSLKLADNRIELGSVTINLSQQRVEALGQPVTLTVSEYRVLEALALRRGSTLSKGQLMSAVYGGIDEPNDKIIDVFICKIRKKLAKITGGDHCIHTVWGRGYMAAPLAQAN